jgi:hypothetical protein
VTLLVRAPSTYLAERRYVLDVVLSEWLGIDYELELGDASRVVIRLAGDPGDRQLALPDVLFATPPGDWLIERSLPVTPLAWMDAGAGAIASGSPSGGSAKDTLAGLIPVLFGERGLTDRVCQESATGLELAIDVFGGVFFLLTRYEEVVQSVRDGHERFPGSASLAAREGFLERPIADEYVDLLWTAMHTLWPNLVRRPFAFRLRVTHDVDWPWAAKGQRLTILARAIAGDFIYRHDPVVAAKRARSLIDAQVGRVDRDPFNNFNFLLDTSERHGVRSTFYFMAGQTNQKFDGNYRLTDPPIADLIRRIHDRGHEIGLHASYETHRSAGSIRFEFETLRAACRALGFDQPAWGVRQHFLRFEAPQTWRLQDLAGLDHDSTIGFADRVGFRAGTCREYPVFDLVERERLRLCERPLLLMDATLFEYLRLSPSDAASKACDIIAACRRHNGDAVILYHNSSLVGTQRRSHFRDVLEEFARSA